MDMESTVNFFNMTFEVFFVDLLLSGDNAIVIALACRSLPIAKMKKAIVIGTILAIVLRTVLTMISSYILYIPGLKLLGGLTLLAIAIELVLGGDNEDVSQESHDGSADIWSAVRIIIVADLVMSVDNVVALTAISQGSFFILVLGLMLSVPLLMFGSVLVTTLINDYPIIISLGGALLGWLAGSVAVADSLFDQWIKTQAQSLPYIIPMLTAIFVLLRSRMLIASKATSTLN